MATIFNLPFADVGSGIKPSDGAQLFFYETGTDTFKNTFTTSAASVANSNPVIASPTGVFPQIYLTGKYWVTLKDKNNVQIWAGVPVESLGNDVVFTIDDLAASSSELKAVYLELGDRSGMFIWNGSNLFSKVALDTLKGIYVATSTDLTGASGAWQRVVEGPYNIKWFSALINVDSTAQTQVALNVASGEYWVDLFENQLITGIVLPPINSKIDGKKCTVKNGTNLVFEVLTGVHDVKIKNVVFDCEEKDVQRLIRVRGGAHRPIITGITYKNIDSTTYVRALDFDHSDVKDFEFDKNVGINLKAPENGVIGDINGQCHVVAMSNDGLTTTTPSSGKINNTSGRDLLPREDADLVYLQSIATANFAITIDKSYGINVAKRIVKVQCNGVNVSNTYADGVDLAVPMYVVVSLYGNNNVATNTQGVGKVNGGVDIQGDNCSADLINIKNESAFLASFGGAITAGYGSTLHNITATNVDNIAKARSIEGNISDAKISLIRGESFGEIVLVATKFDNAFNVLKVKVNDIDAKSTSSTKHAVFAVNETGSTGTITDVVFDDFNVVSNGYFIAVEMRDVAGKVNLSNIEATGHTSIGVKATRGNDVNINEINANLNTVEMIDCNRTISTNIRRGTVAGVRVDGGNDHIVDGVYTRVGATAVAQVNTPTNVQIGTTFAMAT
jgi:hypothetical protein